MTRKLNIILSLILVISATTSAQTYNVKNISGLEGLSQSTVNTVCIDSIGYIWLGTHFGLNKYDGRSVKKYFWENTNPNSLSDDYINLIYEDDDGEMWVSTHKGICKYNREDDSFIRNPIKTEYDLPVNVIFEDDESLWFPRWNYSIIIYNKGSRSTRELKINPNFKLERSNLEILNVIDYDEDRLLMLIDNLGLVILDKNDGTLEKFMIINSIELTGLQKIHDFIYLSSNEDVYKISMDGEIVNTFSAINPNLQSQIFLDIKENKFEKNIWVSTDYGGIFKLDSNFNILDRIQAGQAANQILPENSIKNIHFNNENTIVLGTVRCGAVILFDSGLGCYSYNKKMKTGPSDNSILCMAEDSKNHLWIGTDGGGLNYYDNNEHVFYYYDAPEVQIVTSILDFNEEDLLVASYQNGLFFFNKRSRTFRAAGKHPFFIDVRKEATHKLFRDSYDNIWISDGRLIKVDEHKQLTEIFNVRNNPETFQNPDIFGNLFHIFFSAFEASSGKVWFCTIGGLYSYSLKDDCFDEQIILSDFDSNYGEEAYSVVEDKFGNLIIGTDKALLYYNVETKQLSEYVMGSVEMHKLFSLLYIDIKNQLWVGTNDGLMKIVKTVEKEEISLYNNLETGGSVEYRYGAVLRSFDKNLYLGSNRGITYLIPEDIKCDEVVSKVVFTTFNIIGNKKGISIDSTIVIEENRDFELTLPYSPATYKFEFNSFNIPLEDYTNYSYILENFEENWHTGSANYATYTNLAAGEYVFKVKSTNKTGQWSTETSNFRINILPPWYETAWFWLLVFLFISGLIFYIWRESILRLKLKYRLEIELSEQEQLKLSNQQKLTFFTNISHEIKTPLTLIYSPLKHLLNKKATDNEIRQALPSLYRNSRRMVDLIDQLLEFRKAEMSTLKLNIVEVDCVEESRLVIEYFDYFSKIENIKVELQTKLDKLFVKVDKEKFTKILFNLISNAVKHSVAGDSVQVIISEFDKSFKIEVKDTGSGIAHGELEKIFERYYQTENSVAGTGIGLALTKYLVELHKGSIIATSEESKGATFTVIIPMHQESGTIPAKRQNIEHEQKIIIEAVQSKFVDEELNKEYKILIIEDEWELRHYLKKELLKQYRVVTAKNGKEGFSLTIKEMPDLIISDIMMPEMNGIELCENIKNDIRISHIPVVLLTAKSLAENQAEGYKCGADVYIPKPFDIELLCLQIRSLIHNRQILKKRFKTEPGITPEELTKNDLDKNFLKQAIAIIEENIENQNFKVDDFVKGMGMSRTLVYNKISAIAGKPVKDFILNIRLQKAAHLLTTSNQAISEIAYACGFSDPSYFSTVFKRYYSQSPASFRKNYLEVSLKSENGFS